MKCKKHNIEMHEVINLDLGNLKFKPTMQCKVCEQIRYNPWHEAQAKKFEAEGNFERAKKHRDMIVGVWGTSLETEPSPCKCPKNYHSMFENCKYLEKPPRQR